MLGFYCFLLLSRRCSCLLHVGQHLNVAQANVVSRYTLACDIVWRQENEMVKPLWYLLVYLWDHVYLSLISLTNVSPNVHYYSKQLVQPLRYLIKCLTADGSTSSFIEPKLKKKPGHLNKRLGLAFQPFHFNICSCHFNLSCCSFDSQWRKIKCCCVSPIFFFKCSQERELLIFTVKET